MKPITTCLTPTLLHQLTHDELSSTALESIESHLDRCESCRALLAQAESDELWHQQIAPILKSPDADPLSDYTIDAERGVNSSLNSLLRLLGPVDDPRMLGRIGSYEVAGVIGRGGMGVVFKAFDRALNRYVAIKMLLPHWSESEAARKRFAREGRAAAAVVDDHVMPIYSVAEWQDVPYLVMQYSRGTTLQKRVEYQGPLELKEILRIGMQTARGLAAAHAQGLVHRDVKPSNILVDDTVERALLTDFGLARAVDDASITRSGVIAGTPQYMSPEQARAAEVDARSDLFSLGSVLYFLCTARQPFRAESSYAILRLIIDQEPPPIQEINPDLPTWLCTLISHLMAKSPADRPATAQEVAELLQRCLAHLQQPATVQLPPSIQSLVTRKTTPLHPISSRSVLFAIGTAALLILFAISSQVAGWRLRSTNSDSTSAAHLSVPDISGLWKVQGQASERITIQHEGSLPGHFTMRSVNELSDRNWAVEWHPDRQQFEGDLARFGEVTGRLKFIVTPAVGNSRLHVDFVFSDVQKRQFIHSHLPDRDSVPVPDLRPFEATEIEALFENLSHQTWLRLDPAMGIAEVSVPAPSKVNETEVPATSTEEFAFHKFESGAIAAAALDTWRNYVEWWNLTEGTPLITTAEIPRVVWSEPLLQLDPKYIYANGLNLVIVREQDEVGEEGIYVALGISSSHGPDDDQFTRTLIAHASGGDVYTFRRKGRFTETRP